MAEHYGVPVILHTDHCAKKLLPWIDGLLDAGEKHFAATGKPLFSSHMIDLSEESLEENIEICSKYPGAYVQNGHDPRKSNWVAPAVKKTVWTTATWTLLHCTLSQKTLITLTPS